MSPRHVRLSFFGVQWVGTHWHIPFFVATPFLLKAGFGFLILRRALGLGKRFASRAQGELTQLSNPAGLRPARAWGSSRRWGGGCPRSEFQTHAGGGGRRLCGARCHGKACGWLSGGGSRSPSGVKETLCPGGQPGTGLPWGQWLVAMGLWTLLSLRCNSRSHSRFDLAPTQGKAVVRYWSGLATNRSVVPAWPECSCNRSGSGLEARPPTIAAAAFRRLIAAALACFQSGGRQEAGRNAPRYSAVTGSAEAESFFSVTGRHSVWSSGVKPARGGLCD